MMACTRTAVLLCFLVVSLERCATATGVYMDDADRKSSSRCRADRGLKVAGVSTLASLKPFTGVRPQLTLLLKASSLFVIGQSG